MFAANRNLVTPCSQTANTNELLSVDHDLGPGSTCALKKKLYFLTSFKIS